MTSDFDVVIPAFRCADTLPHAIEGLRHAGVEAHQIFVVDDASGDDTEMVARAHGVNVLVQETNQGAAAARNRGAAEGQASAIVFVDADVVLQDRAHLALLAHLDNYAAAFGSYDAHPSCQRRISRIRNLFHYWTHQQNEGDVASFWTGLGAVRRAEFDSLDGFNEDLDFMEDVDLGRRLWAAGHRSYLDPKAQGRHLKSWSLMSMIRTDFWGRAVPWSRLLLSQTGLNIPSALNTDRRGKWSVGLVAASLISTAVGLFLPWFFVLMAACLLGIALLHQGFLSFLFRSNQPADAIAGVLVLWLLYFCAGIGFFYVSIEHMFSSLITLFQRRRTKSH